MLGHAMSVNELGLWKQLQYHAGSGTRCRERVRRTQSWRDHSWACGVTAARLLSPGTKHPSECGKPRHSN